MDKITIELTPYEARAIEWHLAGDALRGMNVEGRDALKKIREAIKEYDKGRLFTENDGH